MHLMEDCEALRRHLNISAWDVVLGGSWGSTLALAYAQEYPQRIKSLILRGVCLLRPAEIDWLFTPQGGAAQKNPRAWQAFADTVGLLNSNNDTCANSSEHDMESPDRTVLHEYYDRMFGKNSSHRGNAARSWMIWEYTVSKSFNKKRPESATNVSNSDENSARANQTDDTPQSPAVLVSPAGSEVWNYHDKMGNLLSGTDLLMPGLDPLDRAIAECRQGLAQSPCSSSSAASSSSVAPRPIAMTSSDFVAAQEEQMGNFSGLPALPMLTCYYSVNEKYVMNNLDLLSTDRMERLPCEGYHSTGEKTTSCSDLDSSA